MEIMKRFGLPYDTVNNFSTYQRFIIFYLDCLNSFIIKSSPLKLTGYNPAQTFKSRKKGAVSSGKAVLIKIPEPISNPAASVMRGIILICHW